MGNGVVAFGNITFDTEQGLLSRDGVPLSVSHRAIALLRSLVADEGQSVSKAELMEAAWPGQIVEEGNLTVQMAALRKAIGEDWIVTVPRVGYRLLKQSGPAAKTDEPTILPSLAVLPFDNLSRDVDQDYFADGIVEDVIAALSRFKTFAVISRNSSFKYKGKPVDVRDVSRELDARYLLSGSVRVAGAKLRLTVHLVDGVTAVDLWTQTFDGVIEDVFDMQDSITASVAALVEPKIQQAEIHRSRRERPGSQAAYDYYLRGLQKLRTDRADDNAVAISLLEKSIALDPGSAPALVHAVYAYEHRVTMGWPQATEDDAQRALRYVDLALAADRDDAIVLARCGFAVQCLRRDFEQGLKLVTRAVEINPNNVLALFVAGATHVWCGSLAEAEKLFRRCIDLSPGDTANALCGIAHINVVLGNYQEALDWARRAQIENPNHDVVHWLLVASCALLGQKEEARRWLKILKTLSPDLTLFSLSAAHHQKDGSRMAAIIKGLRLAGLPEA